MISNINYNPLKFLYIYLFFYFIIKFILFFIGNFLHLSFFIIYYFLTIYFFIFLFFIIFRYDYIFLILNSYGFWAKKNRYEIFLFHILSWRRWEDLNLRGPYEPYQFSKLTPSTTWVHLQMLNYYNIFLYFSQYFLLKKLLKFLEVLILYVIGGECGIWTHGRLFAYTSFRD